MTYLIAAAGTGGHVYPGLAVAEGLVDLGVPRNDVVFCGGDRLEATVYPREGFEFVELNVRGLKRSLSLENLKVPASVIGSRSTLRNVIHRREVDVVLGMGGYVTVSAALAARATGVPFFNAEQNADAGLANRVTARWAAASFTSFPTTEGLPRGSWVGNPVRREFWDFDRNALSSEARSRYGLSDGPVLGVFGGSLGSGPLNDAVADMLEGWEGDIQVVHLTGRAQADAMSGRRAADQVMWVRLAEEDRMDLFYAAVDLVVARAGGAVAELTATSTPSILVPGSFGSAGHQAGNARFLEEAGCAVVLRQSELDELGATVASLLYEPRVLAEMAEACHSLARPDAARTIARALMEAA